LLLEVFFEGVVVELGRVLDRLENHQPPHVKAIVRIIHKSSMSCGCVPPKAFVKGQRERTNLYQMLLEIRLESGRVMPQAVVSFAVVPTLHFLVQKACES